jgi:high-affinity Fe2+/Pb2+ permease
MAFTLARKQLSLGERLQTKKPCTRPGGQRKRRIALEGFASAAMAIAMLAAFVLAIGGIRLLRRRENRGRGLLMLAAAAVLVMNVAVWTI